MLLMQSHNKWLLLFFMLLMLAGCASSTEIFIPGEIKPIPNGYARIVVTRTKQLAGKYTPVYILDIGDELESNGDIVVRVGDWITQPGLTLWYMPDMLSAFSRGGFTLIPSSNFFSMPTELNFPSTGVAGFAVDPDCHKFEVAQLQSTALWPALFSPG